MSLPPYSFKHLMSIISSSKIATLFKFVSTVLFHRSSAILDFMEVTAGYSFPDFRSPFPVPRSPFLVLVASVLGCFGPAPYWLIEDVFEPSTTTLSSKLIFLCGYTLKELSLFIVLLETTSKLITFSQRSIKLLVGIYFEFFTPVKLTEIQRRISLLPHRFEGCHST